MGTFLIFLVFGSIAVALVVIICFIAARRDRRNPLLPGGNRSDSGFWSWFDCNSGSSSSSDSTHNGSSHHGHSGTSHHGGGFDGGGHHGGGFDGGCGFSGGHH